MKRVIRAMLLLTLLSPLAIAQVASAQAVNAPTVVTPASTQPAGAASVFDGQPIKRPTAPGSGAAPVPAAPTFDWQRLAAAMAIVLTLIVGLRYAMLRLFPGARVGRGTGAVRIIARTAIAPRQQVLLLQVGRRVVVVGDSAGTLTSLAQIDDPDEAASLIGQIENAASPAAAPLPGRFGSMFNRQRQSYEPLDDGVVSEPDPEPSIASDSLEPPPAEVRDAQQEISGLIDRMRSLTKTIRQ